MSVAHYLTSLRILISPLFLMLYCTYKDLGISSITLPWLLLVFIIIAEISDMCDGYLARKYNQVTDLGKILDPMADSIYRISVFLTFTRPPISIPIWIVFAFIYRDTLISGIRTVCALKGFALAARVSGKIKAIIQGVAAILVIVLLILESYGLVSPQELTSYSTMIVGFTAIYALLSSVDYIVANRFYLSKVLQA